MCWVRAAIGILAHAYGERTNQEIGIRMALGAHGRMLQMVLWQVSLVELVCLQAVERA